MPCALPSKLQRSWRTLRRSALSDVSPSCRRKACTSQRSSISGCPSASPGAEALTEPVVNRRFAKMAKRGIADIVHQAGHLHHALEWPGQLFQAILFQQPLLFQPAQHLFGDIAPHLLHLQRVGQASAHRRVALEREDLSFCCRRRIAGELTIRPRSLSKIRRMSRSVSTRGGERKRRRQFILLRKSIFAIASPARAIRFPLKRMIDYATKPDTSRVNL